MPYKDRLVPQLEVCCTDDACRDSLMRYTTGRVERVSRGLWRGKRSHREQLSRYETRRRPGSGKDNAVNTTRRSNGFPGRVGLVLSLCSRTAAQSAQTCVFVHWIGTRVFLDAPSADQGRGVGGCWRPHIYRYCDGKSDATDARFWRRECGEEERVGAFWTIGSVDNGCVAEGGDGGSVVGEESGGHGHALD